MKHFVLKLAEVLGCIGLLVAPLSCREGTQGISFEPGQVYLVSTETDSGYAVFEKGDRRSQWTGTFYADNHALFAKDGQITLSTKGSKQIIRDEGGEKHRVLSIVPYAQPEFREEPPTWTYKDSAYRVAVDSNVTYATAQGYWSSLPGSEDSYLGIYVSQEWKKVRKKMLSLTMDVYRPEDGEKVLRPLLVLIHGGAFYNGDKASPGFPEWGRYFAARGYLVASVNYRLGFFANTTSVERAGFRAVQDVNAAIRFLVHDKDRYHVDPDRVFVAGTSAGGITALNLAFMHKENIPDSASGEGAIDSVNPDLTDHFSIRAVGNLWGAVHDLEMIGNEDIPIISFHSSGDPVVPFIKDSPFREIYISDILFEPMYGSGSITPYAQKRNRKAELHSYDLPGRHTLHLDGERINSVFYEIESGMKDFFSSVMLPHPVAIQHTENSTYFSIDDTDVADVSWKVDGGVILESDHEKVRVLLFPDAEDHAVTVSGKYRSGLTFIDKFSL